jgi:hypothetical protein
MDRREFLKSIFATTVLPLTLSGPNFIESILQDTAHYSDIEFEDYIRWQVNIWVTSPAKCGIITNITEI